MEQRARTTARTTAAHANFAIHYSWSPFEQSYHHRLSTIPTTRPRASPPRGSPTIFRTLPVRTHSLLYIHVHFTVVYTFIQCER